jgi:hypothetical protein
MIVKDRELNKLFLDIRELLQPKEVDKLLSHMMSIYRRVEDLRESRDNWKKKYEKIKS